MSIVSDFLSGWKTEIIAGLLVATTSGAALYFHSQEELQKEIVAQSKKDLSTAQSTITGMQQREKQNADLDTKHTQQLEQQQQTIDDLRTAVNDGTKRLHIAAKCPVTRNTNTTSTGGVVNATTPELDRTAVENYLTLRQRIVLVTNQVLYLQDYIRTQLQQEK